VFVLLATLVLVGIGVWSALRLPIDAVPDITNVQVQINTAVPALAPEEIEKLVTFPIENEMAGMPGLTNCARSPSSASRRSRSSSRTARTSTARANWSANACRP
jgi:Cu/Ag efflux pump CusA